MNDERELWWNPNRVQSDAEVNDTEEANSHAVDITDVEDSTGAVENEQTMDEEEAPPGDDHPPDAPDEEMDEPIIEGDPVSILDPEFEGFVAKFNDKLRLALILMLKRNRSAVTVEAKIRFERGCDGLRRKYETGYVFDPEKDKDKDECSGDLPISLDPSGMPVITSRKGTQLSFDDVRHDGGMTITTDASGVVTSIEPDYPESEEPEDAREEADDDVAEAAPDEVEDGDIDDKQEEPDDE